MTVLVGCLGALAAFFVADMIWLSATVDRVYRPTLGDLAAARRNTATRSGVVKSPST
jgi:uncharacterized membrane protein